MIYPEQRPDFLPRSWNASQFDQQFKLIMDEGAFVGATKEGFVELTLFEKIAEFIIGFFGGTDITEQERVQSLWLKFLLYGEVHGFITEDHIERLKYRLSHPYHHFDPAIPNLFKELRDFHHKVSHDSRPVHLNNLREIVIDYHHQHATLLRPGFWRRLFTSPPLDIAKLVLFGDAPLQLSQKALERKVPNYEASLVHLAKAFDLKNSTPEFQEQLAKQLEKLDNDHLLEIEKHKRKIQELWVDLAKTAFENHLPDLANDYLARALKIDPKHMKTHHQIGKLYLLNKEYDLALPFLSDLRKAFPSDLDVQLHAGHAYWQANQFENAMESYERALSCYQHKPEKFSAYQDQIADMSYRMATAHLKKHIPKATVEQGLEYLLEAVQLDPNADNYHEDLYKTYLQEWHSSHDHFVAHHEQNWMKGLSKLQPSLLKNNQAEITQILLECGEMYFISMKNNKAHACLQKAIELFPSNVDVKVMVLGLAIKYKDCEPYESQLGDWEMEHNKDPYLKEKIGDVFWESDKERAVIAYEESVALFDLQLSVCDDEDRKVCQQHMADIEARMGEYHLKTKKGLFRGVDVDAAMKSFKRAAELDPKNYSSTLFDKCIAAAEAEKQRSVLSRDNNKVMEHFQKAFDAQPQNGDYLVELMKLYLDNKKDKEAVALYNKIIEEEWGEDFVLPASVFHNLAKKCAAQKDDCGALYCYRRAFELDAATAKHQYDYFQYVLQTAQQGFEKFQKGLVNEEERLSHLTDLSIILEECYKKGFDNAKKLKDQFDAQLALVHKTIASCLIQGFLTPEPSKEMMKEELANHVEFHKDDIDQAVSHYDKALTYRPSDPIVHFDKGVLLLWLVEFEKAIKHLESAIKHQPNNPFYHKVLAPLYFAGDLDSDKKDEHNRIADEWNVPNLADDYFIWTAELMCKKKSKVIDPHSFTQTKKGMFGW